MVIDFHSHNFPEALAPRALAAMTDKLRANGCAFGPFGDGTIATQLRDMDRAGVDVCVNCPVATKPAQFEAIYRRACEIREGAAGAAAAERLAQLGSVHPRDPDFRAHVETLRAAGIPGVKLHPFYQGISLGDPELTPFFTALRDAGLFVISHCGADPGYPAAAGVADPAAVAALLRAVPGLTFVAGHLGGVCGSAAGATDELRAFVNCYIDTAVVYSEEESDEARRVAAEWPAERVVFGTDYFWRDEARVKAWVEDRRPDAAARERIFQRNAERLLAGGARVRAE